MRAYFAALFAVASVAGLLTGAAFASHRGPRDEPSTRELVDPVWKAVFSAQTHFTLVRKELSHAATERPGGWTLAEGDLRSIRRALESAIRELPPILESPFVLKTLNTVIGLEERAERAVKIAKNPKDAFVATRGLMIDAEAQLERLFTYLDLTVVEIRATFNWPVTTYDAEVYLSAHFPRGVSFKWSNSNDCGDFRSGPNQLARWSHPDSKAPGACPVQPVHPGTITAIASSGEFSCTGVYPAGSAAGTETSPAREPCTVRK